MMYGKDPDLINPKVTWTYTLSKGERSIIEQLSDLILQLPNNFLSPSQIGIANFFDEWISAPYPKQVADRTVITNGIAFIEGESLKRYNQGFILLDDEDKKQIIDSLIVPTPLEINGIGFFTRFRYLLIGGYYTSDYGFEAIGYMGNIPLKEFPQVSEKASTMIKEELKRLGLSH